MSAATLCPNCRDNPEGIDGHAGLENLSQRGAHGPSIAFRCGDCEARWSRHYVGGGIFQWVLDRAEATT